MVYMLTNKCSFFRYYDFGLAEPQVNLFGANDKLIVEHVAYVEHYTHYAHYAHTTNFEQFEPDVNTRGQARVYLHISIL